jgi:hypothetical protein
MDGEDVFGRKITASYPNRVLERDKKEGSPIKTQSGKEYFSCRGLLAYDTV